MEQIYGIGPDAKTAVLTKLVRRAINSIVIWVILYVGIIGFIFDNTDSALVNFAVGASLFAVLLYGYIKRVISFRNYLNSGLRMVLTDSKLTCEMHGEVVLDLDLDNVTFIFDRVNLKYRTADGQQLEFPGENLIGFDQYWDLCDRLNKKGKMENYGFQEKQ